MSNIIDMPLSTAPTGTNRQLMFNTFTDLAASESNDLHHDCCKYFRKTIRGTVKFDTEKLKMLCRCF